METTHVSRFRKKMARNRRAHQQFLIRFAAAAVGLGFLINLITPSKKFSAGENRNLAQRPALSAEALRSGSWFSDFDTYYADQFVGRDFWMTLDFTVNYMRGQREFSNVYTGRDGYLLSAPETPDETAVQNTVAAVNSFAQAYPDVPVSMMVVPDAASVIADRLPAHVSVRNQATDILRMESGLDNRIQRIDAATALKLHTSQQLYYRTDHHWTSLGAYVGFLNAASVLGIDSELLEYKAHTVSDTFQGTLASRSGDHRQRDTIEVYEAEGTDVLYVVNYPDEQFRSRSVFVSDRLNEKDQYTVFFGGNHSVVEIQTTNDNGRNLLIFKDSYANCFVQFLIPYYETITMIDPRYYYGDVSQDMRNYAVTDVLFLYSMDTLALDTSLADALNLAASDTQETAGGAAAAADNGAAEQAGETPQTAESSDAASGSQTAEPADASGTGEGAETDLTGTEEGADANLTGTEESVGTNPAGTEEGADMAAAEDGDAAYTDAEAYPEETDYTGEVQ